MEFNRNYQTTAQTMSGMFCSRCGRPTILSSGLCPSCCNDRFGDREYRATLPELPITDHKYTSKNKLDSPLN